MGTWNGPIGVKPVHDAVGRATQALLDLAWPSTCGGCERWGPAWCDVCEAHAEVTPSCVRPSLAPALRVHTAAEYAGPLAHAITAFKDHGRSDLGPVLAGFLRVAVAEALADGVAETAAMRVRTRADEPPVLVVPVPSSPSATRARGRFPWGEVVRLTVRTNPGLEGLDVLVSGRATLDQAHLSRAERARNMTGAVRVSTRRPRRAQTVRGRRVVVVDDVVTTGASLGAAVMALTPLRPLSVSCATIAAAR